MNYFKIFSLSNGESEVEELKFNLSTEDQILNFQLKKPMNLDRKSLNLLRKQQIQAEIS